MARRRWLRQPLSWQRGGAVALIVLIIVMIAALMLDRESGHEVEPLLSLIERRGAEPVRVIEDVAGGASIVLLSDIAGVGDPKRLAAAAVRIMAEGPGLDAVVLEVPSSEQPYIDTYLNADEEDAAQLMNRPAAVREEHGAAREFLEIYRAVWAVNREVGAARRVRIIAVDMPEWPPPRGASGTEAAELYAARPAYMVQRMEDELLSRMPDARLLVFVDGYQTLQRTHGEARFAGGDAVRVEWLAEQLRQRHGRDVRSVLVDAAASTAGVRSVPGYHGTELHRALRRSLRGRNVGLRVDDTFSTIRSPVLETSSPAMRLDIRPSGYVLRDVADGYVYLGGR